MSESETGKRTSRLSGFIQALRRDVEQPGAVDPGTTTKAVEPARAAVSPKTSAPPRNDKPSGQPAHRTWDPEEWEEDQRYVDAMDLYSLGNKRDALTRLDALFRDDPGHLFGRVQLFQIALELGHQETVAEHNDWIVGYYTQRHEAVSVCQVYRDARLQFPELAWSERALVQAMLAGDKSEDARIVVDATKLLIHTYPESPALPRAMLAGARVQESEGRPDLARTTLQHIVHSFPLDPIAEMAKRKLQELG